MVICLIVIVFGRRHSDSLKLSTLVVAQTDSVVNLLSLFAKMSGPLSLSVCFLLKKVQKGKVKGKSQVKRQGEVKLRGGEARLKVYCHQPYARGQC